MTRPLDAILAGVRRPERDVPCSSADCPACPNIDALGRYWIGGATGWWWGRWDGV